MRISSITVALICAAAPVAAQPFANAKTSLAGYSAASTAPKKACESLSGFKGKEITTIQSRVVMATGDAPQHCRVTGIIAPEVAFEVDLPDRWNRRFYMTGNGGLAGDPVDQPTTADRASALTNGFVMARTNTGHDARKESGGSFILSNPQKAIDYAYRAVHVTADLAKAIAKDYYGEPVSFSYWNSCSNGGRQGLLEVQRYPDEFDGVVANAPWVDQTGFTIGAIWNQKALTEAPVTPAKVSMVAKAVVDKCDAVDGLKDGLIDDPRKCSFDPARDVPACPAGTDNADCLTKAQAATLKKIYGGPVSNGKPYFPGGGLQPRRRRDEVSRARPAERRLRHAHDGFQQGLGDRRAMEQASRREGDGLVEVSEARQVDHDVRLGRPNPAAVDGRQLLPGARREERQRHDGFRATVHGPRHVPLCGRCRPRSQ
jgi:Tannase and feruloyl esterase